MVSVAETSHHRSIEKQSWDIGLHGVSDTGKWVHLQAQGKMPTPKGTLCDYSHLLSFTLAL
jgi:hypothetical protein